MTAPTTHPSASLVLAADVGGTHARIGLLRDRAGDHAPGELLAWRVYECAQWQSLACILEDFLAAQPRDRGHVARCALAVAGFVRGDALTAENLCWPIRISELRARLQVSRLDIVNDFEALACACQFLDASAGIGVLDAARGDGPVVVLGPGTGLGCAVLLPQDAGAIVLPSEGGHVALAPGNEREMDVLRQLGRGRGYVHTGLALSGPGLLNLYRALAEIDGVAARHVRPQQVSAAALRGDDPCSREALSMFCAMLGSFAGDLAILFKAGGGLFLAGGILPHISDFLLASDFRNRFLNKGVMRDFLASIPVRLIEHGQLGVVGAAEATRA